MNIDLLKETHRAYYTVSGVTNWVYTADVRKVNI